MRHMFLVLAAALPLLADIPLPPAPSRYVTDAANVIPDDRQNALNEKLAEFDRETSNQILVYVDRRIPAGTTLEEMSAEAIRTWGIGDEKKDNGAILFLFIEERASRLEVGYGLEGQLTDAHSRRILVSLRPALRSGDFATAAEDGVDAITRTITGEHRAPLANQVPIEAPPPERLMSDDLIIAICILLGAMFLLGIVAYIILNFFPQSREA